MLPTQLRRSTVANPGDQVGCPTVVDAQGFKSKQAIVSISPPARGPYSLTCSPQGRSRKPASRRICATNTACRRRLRTSLATRGRGRAGRGGSALGGLRTRRGVQCRGRLWRDLDQPLHAGGRGLPKCRVAPFTRETAHPPWPAASRQSFGQEPRPKTRSPCASSRGDRCCHARQLADKQAAVFALKEGLCWRSPHSHCCPPGHSLPCWPAAPMQELTNLCISGWGPFAGVPQGVTAAAAACGKPADGALQLMCRLVNSCRGPACPQDREGPGGRQSGCCSRFQGVAMCPRQTSGFRNPVAACTLAHLMPERRTPACPSPRWCLQARPAAQGCTGWVAGRRQAQPQAQCHACSGALSISSSLQVWGIPDPLGKHINLGAWVCSLGLPWRHSSSCFSAGPLGWALRSACATTAEQQGTCLRASERRHPCRSHDLPV